MKGTASKSENKITAIMAIFLMILVVFILKNGSFKAKEGIVNPITQVTVDKSVVPGSCLILEEKYCRMVERRFVNGTIFAAFKLPADVPIFSPYDGTMSMSTDYRQYYVSVYKGVKPNDDRYKTKSVFRIDFTGVVDGVMKNEYQISNGNILARTGETSLTNLAKPLNGYNLVMYFTKYDPSKPDNAKTKTVFGIS
jgi:hypothetical protein